MKIPKQGLYALYLKDELIYIGKSTNLKARLRLHKIVHDTFRVLEVANESDMGLLELMYIDTYKPIENILDNNSVRTNLELGVDICIDFFTARQKSISVLHKKADYKGVVRMNKKLIDVIVDNNGDVGRLVRYLINNVTSNGELVRRGKTVAISKVAETIGVTPSTLSRTVTKLVNQDVIKKQGRKIILSPYLYVPYNTSDDKLFILQNWWDSDFTYDITDELEVDNRELERRLLDNTPIGGE